MAIKTKNSRDTYRSNVKLRPLRQNGLEAQYQGLDVREVNIDHSGLPILARGGFQNARNFTKVHKEYIVDLDAEEHYPRASLTFKDRSSPWIVTWKWESGKNDWTGDINFTLRGLDYTMALRNTADGSDTTFNSERLAYISVGDGSALDPSSEEFSVSLLDVLSDIEAVLVNLFNSLTNWSHSETTTSFSITDSSKTAINYIRNTDVSYLEANQTPDTTPPSVRAGNYSATGGVASVGVNELDTRTFSLKAFGAAAPTVQFQFATGAGNTNGEQIVNPAGSDIAIVIPDDGLSVRDVMMATTGSIQQHFGLETFTFNILPKGSTEVIDGEARKVLEDRLDIMLMAHLPNVTSPTAPELTVPGAHSAYFEKTNTFGGQNESHEWRLNGFREQTVSTSMFYEDLRTDILQSFAPHERRKAGTLLKPVQKSRGAIFPTGDTIINMDSEISARINATGQSRYTTKVSDELLIRQTPKRQEVFGTFRDNHEWREDRHYLSMVDQRWSQMQDRYNVYDADFESHISAMLDTNFADEQYFEPNILSGRVDVFNRLARIFDTHNELLYERHSMSVFDQYLDPIDDFRNLQDNRYPKKDETSFYTQVVQNPLTLAVETINHTNDAAFEDVVGKRRPLEEDTASLSQLLISFSGALSAGDKISLTVGNGYNADMAIVISFNSGGNHDSSVQPLSYFRGVDLEIDVATIGAGNPTDDTADYIIAKLVPLITTPVNGVDLSKYSISQPSSGQVLIKAVHPGVGWDVTSIETDSGNKITTTLTSGKDSTWAKENPVMFMDYFDQLPLEAHDYVEDTRRSRIDSGMLEVLTEKRGTCSSNEEGHSYNQQACEAAGHTWTPDKVTRGLSTDQREWQESDYLYTCTGFIGSQSAPQSGIIYRDLKR